MRFKILLKRDGGVLFDYLYNMKKFEEYRFKTPAIKDSTYYKAWFRPKYEFWIRIN
jgi:hypothetical protein